MIYLNSFTLPSYDREVEYLKPDYSQMDPRPGYVEVRDSNGRFLYSKKNFNINRNCFNSHYPFLVLSEKHLEEIVFSDVTIFCGGNGSGKTTLLNVIAQKLNLSRQTAYNRSAFFDDYVLLCTEQLARMSYKETFTPEKDGKIIVSDDVFDYSLRVREESDNMDIQRERLFEQRQKDKLPRTIDCEKPEELEAYTEIYKLLKSKSSKAAKRFIGLNPIEQSNGETGLQYFINEIQPNGLYLLDEPENSLSAEKQIQLKSYIEVFAKMYNCQFIIASHSPFILGIDNALIYNFDTNPITISEWNEIEDVKTMIEFCKEKMKTIQ